MLYDENEYEYEYNRTVSDCKEFSYDDDAFDYTDEEKEQMEKWENWYEETFNNQVNYGSDGNYCVFYLICYFYWQLPSLLYLI